MELFDDYDYDFMLDLNEDEENLLDKFGYEDKKDDADDDSVAVQNYCYAFESKDSEANEYIEEKIVNNTHESEKPDSIKSTLAIDSSSNSTGSVVVKINKKRSALSIEPSLSSNKKSAVATSKSMSTSSTDSSSEGSDRLEFLMTVPGLMMQHINSLNEKGLKELLADACDPFCILVTPCAAGQEITGAENISSFLSSYTSAMPDYVSTARRSTISVQCFQFPPRT